MEKTASGAIRRAIQMECYFSSFVSKGIQRIKRKKERNQFLPCLVATIY
jgi:hypothetical protein